MFIFAKSNRSSNKFQAGILLIDRPKGSAYRHSGDPVEDIAETSQYSYNIDAMFERLQCLSDGCTPDHCYIFTLE